MLIKTVNGKTPVYGEDCYFAENATIIGDVTMGVFVVYGLMQSFEVMSILLKLAIKSIYKMAL
jgi:hypothetical protein